MRKGERYIWKSPEAAERKRVSTLGPNSASWKGGRHYTANGYVMVYTPGHPRVTGVNGEYFRSPNGHYRCPYVMEHIIIWEKANGPLPDGCVVHHLNGVKDDNRLCNLVALTSKKHKLIFEEKAKRIRELEDEIKVLQGGMKN